MAGYHIRPSHNSLDFESLLLVKIDTDYICFLYIAPPGLAFELFPKLLSKGLSALERQHKWSGDIINLNAVIPFPHLCQVHNIFLYRVSLSLSSLIHFTASNTPLESETVLIAR